jgi:dihydropyrimidinase
MEPCLARPVPGLDACRAAADGGVCVPRRRQDAAGSIGEASMLDLIIRGGDVVTPQGVAQCDVAIAGETIVAVAAAGALASGTARREIDASAKIVMPGGIDPHVHLHHGWMRPDGTWLTTAGPEQVGKAALYGGTTTFIDFAYWRDNQTALQAIEARDKDFVGKSPCDWAYHIMLHSEPPHTFAGQLAEAIQAGYPTLKIFTTNILPTRTGRMIDFGDIWEAFQVLSRHGGLGVIHAEDNDIVMHMYAKLIREGRVHFQHLAEAHNQLSEDLSFRRVLRLAESVPGTALYMMHVSAATGVEAVREARARGLPVYGETLHQYMLYSAEDYKRPNGQIYHTYPSLKSKQDQAALWAGTLDGTIQCVATDELCCSLKEKTLGDRIDNTTGGNSGVEPRLAVMYTEMVARRGYALNRYVDLVSTNAAKIMGLYPRKGAIAAGSDADITILDPSRRGKVHAADLHETDYTPWEDHDIFAWPVITILRGKVMVENGQYFANPSDGSYLKRRIPSDILGGLGV